ncbi:MAG TPA: hypothetical protein VNO79_13770, partial [Actinomycetota bacterium]|nr:hypothetical protein [Actinomycetota bacterium]
MASVDPPLGLIAAATVAAGLAVAGILALAGRGLPDPAGRRADAIYLFTVLAVARFLALFSAVAAVRRAIELVVGGPLWAVTVGASAGWHAVPAAAPLAAVHPRAVATYGPVAGLGALPSA